MALSQGEWNQWRFGNKVAIDFSSGNPVVLPPSHMVAVPPGITATVSDSLGNLLFYSNGKTVWNRIDSVMQNGTGLCGQGGPQPVLAVPHIPYDSTYYLFTMGDMCHLPNIQPLGLFYSIVNMRLDGGLGGIVPGKKNNMISSAQKTNNVLTATRHKNNRDVWVLVQSHSTGTPFLAYRITAAGVDTTPVISPYLTGIYSGCTWGGNRFSPDGKKLFSQVEGMGMISNFDNETGVVMPLFMFQLNLGVTPLYAPVAAEFSVDSKYIYIGATSGEAVSNYSFVTLQLDATKTDTTSFLQSAVILGYNSGDLQMAPNGKIYISPIRQWYTFLPIDSLHVINNPSMPGLACGYQPNAVGLNGHNCYGNTPNFLQKYYVYIHYQGFCQFQPLQFSFTVWPPADSLHWDFGDPVSGGANFSNLSNPAHTYTTSGQFTVTLIVRHQDKRMDTAIQVINVLNNPNPGLGVDRSFCDGDSITLTAIPCTGCSYIWKNLSTGQTLPSTGSNLTTNEGGNVMVTVTQMSGCANRDTVMLTKIPIPQIINDTLSKTICSDALTNIIPESNVPGTSFRWTVSLIAGNVTGFSSDSGTIINQFLKNNGTTTGIVTYHITPYIGSCIGSTVDFSVSVSPAGADIGPDTSFCKGSSVMLDAGSGDAYFWSTGDTTRTLTITQGGVYWVRIIHLSCGEASDTVNVTEKNPQINLGHDTVLCQGNSMQLNGGLAELWLWSTGDTIGMITITQPGTYWVRIVRQGCMASDTIILVRGDTIMIVDTTLCHGIPYFAGNSWQTTTGTYHDTLAVPIGCSHYIETHLSYKPAIPLNISKDTVLCTDNLFLNVYFPGARFLWQDGTADSVYHVTRIGTYWVKTEYDNCFRQDTITVDGCPAILWFPNAFTPNGDGLNDTFHPLGTGIEKFAIQIYDRWGILIFISTNPLSGWDGTYQGQPCPADVYIFISTFESPSGKQIKTKGSFVLIR